MLLADLVATSAAVGATRSRKAKVAALAELLQRLEPDEVEPAVGFLTGVPRQGRIGVGWRSVYGTEHHHAAEPSVEVLELDRILTELAGTSGSGSVAARQAHLADLFGRATEAEADFVRRLLTGELRQGALAGVMTDAVATAADVPIDVVRRAAMLSGDLGRTAALALTEGRPALDAVRLSVLQPIQPMLAASAADVGEALGHTGPASVEWKLDGARVQVHRRGDEVRIFTRNLNDITHRLPGVVEVARGFDADAFVLDGEVLGVDEDAKPRAFQDTMSAFGRDDASGCGRRPPGHLLRRPAPRRRRPHRRAALVATAAPGRARRAPRRHALHHRRRRGGGRHARRLAGHRARGRGREGPRLDLRRRSARRRRGAR